MTNREWLNSLSNEELASWLCETSAIIGYGIKIVKVNNESKEMKIAQFDNLYPRFHDLIYQYTNTHLGINEWLNKERNKNDVNK